MSPTDLPQVPSEHAATIIGGNWPQTSETGTTSSVIDLYRRAAESLGTADTAETMHALIETNATGQTPTALVADFTDEQRRAFDRAATQLAQGQGASVMAQDILNTKVQLNGTVVQFDAAVDALLAAAAAAPQTPKTQADFQKRYQELLDAAKQQADVLGKNHLATQDALVAGVQKGINPEIPSTMAATSAENPTVPGMPDNALGSVLQNVMGQMMKPQNLPMPNLGQSVAPLLQPLQSMLGPLMSGLGGAGGGEDALSVLARDSNVGEQGETLSNSAAAGAGAVGAGAAGAAAGANRPTAQTEADAAEKGKADPSAKAQENAPTTLAGVGAQNATAAPVVESVATAPATPAVTAAPALEAPATTLSSGGALSGSETVSSVRTHASSGDVAVGAATLSGGGSTLAGAGGAAGAPMMPMMPMMPGMGGGAGAATGSPATTPSADRPTISDKDRKAFEPDRPAPSSELTDFGSDLRGLAHATDTELVASSILAALVRTHDRAGLSTEVAVGVSATAAVFVTSNGLGFLPPGIRAAGHLTPLITLVPSDFIARWLGCDQPWRPLLEAAALDLMGPFDTVVTTDSGASAFGVLTLTQEQITAVNIAAGSKDRWHFDAVDAADVQPAMDYLESTWGKPLFPAADLLAEVSRSHWTGAAGPGNYPRRWARYLLAAAAADVAAGDIDDARYALRSALRVPEVQEGSQPS
jgi:hypothetical protein